MLSIFSFLSLSSVLRSGERPPPQPSPHGQAQGVGDGVGQAGAAAGYPSLQHLGDDGQAQQAPGQAQSLAAGAPGAHGQAAQGHEQDRVRPFVAMGGEFRLVQPAGARQPRSHPSLGGQHVCCGQQQSQ